LYLFEEIKKRGVPCILSGEAADEVFGGYPQYHVPSMIGKRGDMTGIMPLAIRSTNFLLRDDVKQIVNLQESTKENISNLLETMDTCPSDTEQQARMREIFFFALQWIPIFFIGKKGSVEHVQWCRDTCSVHRPPPY